MMSGRKQLTFADFAVVEKTDPEPWDEMSEEERIDFIRDHGTESMIRGLEYVLQGNKYKPKKEDMWVNRLYRGKRMVRTIIEKNGEDGK